MNKDPRSRNRSYRPWLFVGGGALLLTTACGLIDGSSNKSDKPANTARPQPKQPVATCSFQRRDLWAAVPRGLATQQMANALGVSRADLGAGKLGPVQCDPEVSREAIDEAKAVVQVNGIPETYHVGSICIAYISDVFPGPNAASANATVICPQLAQKS